MYRRLLLGMAIVLALLLAACQTGNPYDAENRKLAQDAGMPDEIIDLIDRTFALSSDNPPYEILSVEQATNPVAFYDLNWQVKSDQPEEIWCVILLVNGDETRKNHWAVWGTKDGWNDALDVSNSLDNDEHRPVWEDAGCTNW